MSTQSNRWCQRATQLKTVLMLSTLLLGIPVSDALGDDVDNSLASEAIGVAIEAMTTGDSDLFNADRDRWRVSIKPLGADPILPSLGFLSENITWQATLDTLTLEFDSGNLPQDTSADYLTTVLIDSSTGQILRVELVNWDKASRDDILVFSEAEYSKYLRGNFEVIHGLSRATAEAGLIEALQACKYFPLFATRIQAYHVEYSRDGSDIADAWVIDLYGAPSLTGHEGFDENSFHHIVVDAKTGNILFGYTIGIPDERE